MDPFRTAPRPQPNARGRCPLRGGVFSRTTAAGVWSKARGYERFGGRSAPQPSRERIPERHRRDHFSIAIPDAEVLSRHVLVLHDPVRNEVPCSCDRLSDGRLEIIKVDPLRVLDDLISIENIKIEARHTRKRLRTDKGCLARYRPR